MTHGWNVSINLSTVKVQNWDKTITTIPTYAFSLLIPLKLAE
jgi:hypothetical protein